MVVGETIACFGRGEGWLGPTFQMGDEGIGEGYDGMG